MTIVNSIDRVGGQSAVDVSMKIFDQSTLHQVGVTQTDVSKGSEKTVYDIMTGDRLWKTVITVTRVLAPTGPARRQMHYTVDFETFARVTDDTAGVDPVIEPIRERVQFDIPNVAIDLADLMDLHQNCISLMFGPLTSKVPSTAILAEVLFGHTDLF